MDLMLIIVIFIQAQSAVAFLSGHSRRSAIAPVRQSKLRNGRASILFVVFQHRDLLFRSVPHLTKYLDRKKGHALLLVGAEGLIERLPRISELLEVG